MAPKRQKTTHTLPATHNGTVVTVTINDSRYHPLTVVDVSIAGRHDAETAAGSVTLMPKATQV